MIRPIACFLAMLLLVAFTEAQSYTVTDVGPGNGLGGGRAINNLGDVVNDNAGVSYLWTPTHSDLGLSPLPGDNETSAMGINSHGLVVGESIAVGYRAVLWTYGKPQFLGTLPGGVISWANAINESGAVAGASDGSNVGPEAIVWTKARGMQGLGFLPGGSYSEAFGINRYGQVAGFSYVANGGAYGFIWSKATGIQNLGSLPGGGGSSANAINDLGQVVGGSDCGAGCQHAALWSKTKGSVQDLGVLAGSTFSSAYGINNLSQVVGSAGYINNSDHAFVWSSTTGMQDLNDLIPANSGWLLEFAFAINDSGQISGVGSVNGKEEGFLLTPVQANSETLASEN
jgi:probable HAF family extracellular repeat protein